VIEKNKVVSISYCLKNTKGEELDQAGADKPLEYLHGCGNIVPGLENALDGLKIGNKKEVTVEPEDGYGEILTDLKMEVERKAFPTDQKIAPGMQFMEETSVQRSRGKGRQSTRRWQSPVSGTNSSIFCRNHKD